MKERYIPIIKEIADEIRKKNGLNNNTVIGDSIFTILQRECVVMMRPIKHQPNLDGFSTEKIIRGRLETVVYINTAKNVEKQNFCAAHELGHRYAVDRMIRDKFPEEILLPSDVEDIMNRFAAELMMPEKEFKNRGAKIWNEYSVRSSKNVLSITIKHAIQTIIKLMDFYHMPYKAVLYRMEEVEIISPIIKVCLEGYEEDNKSVVDQMISDMGITCLRTPDHKIQNSVPVRKDKAIFENPQITKYLTEKELAQYLRNLGVSKSKIALTEKMRKIETEMLDLSERTQPEGKE